MGVTLSAIGRIVGYPVRLNKGSIKNILGKRSLGERGGGWGLFWIRHSNALKNKRLQKI
jgi:hypothetical protein